MVERFLNRSEGQLGDMETRPFYRHFHVGQCEVVRNDISEASLGFSMLEGWQLPSLALEVTRGTYG